VLVSGRAWVKNRPLGKFPFLTVRAGAPLRGIPLPVYRPAGRRNRCQKQTFLCIAGSSRPRLECFRGKGNKPDRTSRSVHSPPVLAAPAKGAPLDGARPIPIPSSEDSTGGVDGLLDRRRSFPSGFPLSRFHCKIRCLLAILPGELVHSLPGAGGATPTRWR